MKRFSLYFFLFSSVLFSCKKDKTASPVTAQKANVTFNVSGFSEKLTPFATSNQGSSIKGPAGKVRAAATGSLSDYISVLYLLIYDSHNNLAANITQQSSDANFGQINVKLNPGTYRVVAAGGQEPGFYTFKINPDTATQFVYRYNGGTVAGFMDTFFKTTSINVQSTGGNFSLALNRVVAQMELDIQDAVPANTKSIQFTFADYSILNFDGSTEGAGGNGGGINSPVAGTTNTKLYCYVLNTNTPLSVKVTAIDISNNVIGQRTIDNVTCKVNAITLLTGDLFTGASGGGVGVSYNPAWKVQTINYTF